ncbi:hypothetical protein [Paenibacillus sp. 1P07SE]|uniref:hypothetical protein n=1 Tax=Paenibacillus sp. 1P07SE TaxID=3132209 RepID=UPI0039A5BF04
MLTELKVAHCTECGEIYQKNLRGLCQRCAMELDRQMLSVERYMARYPAADTEAAAAHAGILPSRIRGWLRSGKLRNDSYPNLCDACDLCGAPVHAGHLCHGCSSRIQTDIRRVLTQEMESRERKRTAVNYRYRA